MRDQVFSRRRIRRNRARRRNMIGGHAVAQNRQRPQAFQIAQRRGLQRHALKIRRVLDVGGFVVPRVKIAFRNRQRAPVLIAGKNVRVLIVKHVARNRLAHGLFHFLRRRPNVAQVHRLSRLVVAQRLVHDIEIHAPGQRVRHHQRRRCQIIRAAQRIDPSFEIPVAAQDRNRDQIIFLDRFSNRFRQRPAVADARRAAVTDQIEAQRIQIRPQAGLLDVIRNDLRAGRKARLHPGLGVQPALHRLLRQQARTQHQRRIRSVGAAGDRRDHHRAVRQFVAVPVVLHRHVLRAFGQRLHERRLGLRQRHAILRPLRSGYGRHHAPQVQLQRVGENRIRRVIGAEQSLFLRIRLDQLDLLFLARRESQIRQRFPIHREKSHRRAVFRRHVGNRRAIRQRQTRQSCPVKFHEFSDHAFLAQHVRHGQHQIRRRRAFRQHTA